jgi:hypothetical protein
MPETGLTLYRGGYNNRVWPADLPKYLIGRSEKGKDCRVYEGADGELWVAGEKYRGLSLFADINGINSPWELPKGSDYPEELTLSENPDVQDDWILAPGKDMRLDAYVELVKSISGWIRRFLFMLDGQSVLLTRDELDGAVRSHIERLRADAASASDADEDRKVELLNDAHLLRLFLRALDSKDMNPEELQGTVAALVLDAVRSAARPGDGPAVQNQITIGLVETPNPNLWLDKRSLGGPVVVYEVSSAAPPSGNDWMAVNQFCSILGVRYLQASPRPHVFGFGNLKHPVHEAETLLHMSSLENQVKWAAKQIQGTTVELQELQHLFPHLPSGVVFWLGNSGHAWAAVKDAGHITLYDPDQGVADYVQLDDFLPLLEALGIDAIVMRQ